MTQVSRYGHSPPGIDLGRTRLPAKYPGTQVTALWALLCDQPENWLPPMINLLICSLPILPVRSAELELSFAIFLHPLKKFNCYLRSLSGNYPN